MSFACRGFVPNFRRSESGNVMIEFALALPVLTIMLVGMIDLGRYAFQQSALLEGARQGAQYGIISYLTSPSGDATGITSTAQNATGLSGVTATPTSFCECVNGTQVACTTTCGSGQVLKQYLKVTVAKPFTSILTGGSISFGQLGQFTAPKYGDSNNPNHTMTATITTIIPQ
jgi:Flp pilus assembly protein TadG